MAWTGVDVLLLQYYYQSVERPESGDWAMDIGHNIIHGSDVTLQHSNLIQVYPLMGLCDWALHLYHKFYE